MKTSVVQKTVRSSNNNQSNRSNGGFTMTRNITMTALVVFFAIFAVSFSTNANTWVGGDGDWLDAAEWSDGAWVDNTLADFNGAQNANRNRINEVFIGLSGSPSSVSPSALQTRGGYGGTFAFSGGDMTGTFDISQGSGNGIIFRRAFSFTGNINLADGAHFLFTPSNAATLTQTINIPGNGTLSDNGNADWSGATINLGGTLSVAKTAELEGADISLPGDRTINLIAREVTSHRFRGSATGAHDLTLAWDNQGYSEVSGMAGALDYAVDNLRLTAENAQILVAPDEWTTAFQNVGGMVMLDNIRFIPRNTADTGNLSTLELYFPLAMNANATLGSATTVNVQSGGVLGGTGTTDDTINVLSGGVINPGASAGTLTLTSPTTFGSGSTLRIEIAGENPGEFDVFNSTSDVTINPGSTLELVFIEGYTPNPLGTSLMDVMNWGNLNGTFDDYLITGDTSLRLDTSQLYTTGELALIPEPTSLALLGLASLLMLRRRRR